jgi:hypothetical protein
VLCNVFYRVSAKLHCFTYFVFLCARHFTMQFEFKIKFLNTGEFSAKSDKPVCACKCDQGVVKLITKGLILILNAQWSLQFILVYSLLAPYHFLTSQRKPHSAIDLPMVACLRDFERREISQCLVADRTPNVPPPSFLEAFL